MTDTVYCPECDGTNVYQRVLQPLNGGDPLIRDGKPEPAWCADCKRDVDAEPFAYHRYHDVELQCRGSWTERIRFIDDTPFLVGPSIGDMELQDGPDVYCNDCDIELFDPSRQLGFDPEQLDYSPPTEKDDTNATE